ALEWRDVDAAVFQRLPYASGDLDRGGVVTVDANRVGAHLDDLAGHGDHGAVLHHPHHAIGNLPGVVQQRARLAARDQIAVVLIGAVSEHLMRHRQVGTFAGLDKLGIGEHHEHKIGIDRLDGVGYGLCGHVVLTGDV